MSELEGGRERREGFWMTQGARVFLGGQRCPLIEKVGGRKTYFKRKIRLVFKGA